MTFDSVSEMHKYMLKLFKTSNPPDILRPPITVGYKKTLDYVFTKKNFIKKLKNKQV